MVDDFTMARGGMLGSRMGKWLPALEAAAERLSPVTIELRSPRRLVRSYLLEVEDRGAGLEAIVGPVCDRAVPPDAPMVVRPDDGSGWELHVPAVRGYRGTEARLALDSARFDECSAPGRGVPTPRGLVVLVIPDGLHDRESYVFPVRWVSAGGCEVESSSPLDPDARFRGVQLIGDRRVLRRADAKVVSTAPVVYPGGREGFVSELALGPSEAHVERPHDLVADPAEVTRLLRLAAITRARGWYEAPGWGRGTVAFEQVGPDDARLRVEGGAGQGCPATSLRVGVELLATEYEIEVRALAREGETLTTSLPLLLRRRRSHRRLRVVQVPEGEHVELAFVNPLSGETLRRQVTGLSFMSVRFDKRLEDAMLWPGAPLERAELRWRGRVIPLGDLEVMEPAEGGDASTMDVRASDSRLVDDVDLIALLAVCAHPGVRVHEGADFSALHDAYVEAGLFAPHMHRNLSPIMEQASSVWRAMHQQAGNVVRTLLHYSGGSIDGAVTVMRAWETGWVAQHFIDVSPSFNNATGKLQTAYLDHVLPRPDGRFLVFFIKRDNRVMQAYMKRFFRMIGTDEAATQHPVELWVHADGCDEGLVDASRPMRDAERRMLDNAAARALGPDAAAALSMVEDGLELPDTRGCFARANLVRERVCRVVDDGGRTAFALLEEHSTPGINLTWMLNATWIVPLHAAPDGAALEAALAAVIARPSQSPTGERFVNLPFAPPEGLLTSMGFERLAICDLFVLNRAGVHQFFQYASRRYGELDARTAARRTRQGVAPLE